MAAHVKLLAILNIILGTLGLLAGALALMVFGGIGAIAGFAADQPSDAVLALPILGGIGVFVFLLIAVFTAPCIIAGVGLLKFRPWARTLTIVMSAFNLLNVPFGTALGVYGLWVLLSNEGRRLFEQPPANS